MSWNLFKRKMDESGVMNKKELRMMIGKRREEVDNAWIAEKSKQAQSRIMSLPEFAAAKNVGCYFSMRKEVRTDVFMGECLKLGKCLCVPAFDSVRGVYGLSRVTVGWTVGLGPDNVPEPLDVEWMDRRDVDLIIVPGVAFDGACGRMGHGGGHYDKILHGDFKGFKVGLAFEFQILDHVPMKKHDVRMDVVITEERTIKGMEHAG